MGVIRIDEKLLGRIKKAIKKEKNKFDFPSIKSFIDKSVLKMLRELDD